jgi:hypothetical protein
VTLQNHGVTQYYNDSYSNSSSYYKPGSGVQITPRDRAINARVMRQIAESLAVKR